MATRAVGFTGAAGAARTGRPSGQGFLPRPNIFAVGDAVEVRDFVTGEWSLIALAGPANRQARIAAEVITGPDSRFRGTQGTAVVGLFGSTVAWTGANEKTLQRLGDSDYEKVYLYPNSHAGYYPGAKPIAMKLLFRKSDGRVLGAQAVGEDGVDKRISELALAIQLGATVYDLEECELCYAPPFGSAKDPINFAGMVAAGVQRGDMPVTHWNSAEDRFLLDVREEVEQAVEQVPEAVNIPLRELRARLDELPRDQEIGVIRRSGQRAYYATRLLLQHGFDAKVMSGGMLSHAILAPPARAGDSRVSARLDDLTVKQGARWRRYGLHGRADGARRGRPLGWPPGRVAASRHPRRTRPSGQGQGRRKSCPRPGLQRCLGPLVRSLRSRATRGGCSPRIGGSST